MRKRLLIWFYGMMAGHAEKRGDETAALYWMRLLEDVAWD